MFNFTKKKEGIDSKTEEQSCCCSETIEVETKQETSCCGCSCGESAPSNKKSSCCGK